jgi:hypothetical protein
VREIDPMVPLMDNMGLGIAVTSYAGTMNFGFGADPDVPAAKQADTSAAPRANGNGPVAAN